MNGLFLFKNNSPSINVSGSFFLLVSGRRILCRPAKKVMLPNTKIGRTGSMSAKIAMKGAAMEPILAMEHAKETPTERMMVGKSSLVNK